ncbi:SET domain-containing protein [Gonapodya prolifera JEL478]|uniref:SET domain-containing protein n=1 Tax=Gonapodya prolifera (strain JEL478) TaxID=1344416 RepID=A0A139AHT8_GONPJ|nr:SET domain-containing protein [Gonapodya prolifera JEL478]|eukprot:KXS16376.1 SET domain-containing protein [Gonapodya prolifera JEL478]
MLAARLSALALLDVTRTRSFSSSLDLTNDLVSARYLTSGERHVPEVWIEDYTAVKNMVWTEPGQAGLFSLEWFVKTMSAFNLNSFRIVLPATTPVKESDTHSEFANESPGSPGQPDFNLQTVGSALFPLASMLNHSCAPNAAVAFSASPEHHAPLIHVLADRDIAEGEEVTISYVDPDGGDYKIGDERRMWLEWAYGFKCRCPRCMHELRK